PVALETDKTQYFIPLIGHTAEESVLVELRSTIRRTSPLELPEFPDDPAVQQVYLAVYMPEERRLLGVSGEWAEEDTWVFDYEQGKYVKRTSRTDAQLLQWVHEEVSV